MSVMWTMTAGDIYVVPITIETLLRDFRVQLKVSASPFDDTWTAAIIDADKQEATHAEFGFATPQEAKIAATRLFGEFLRYLESKLSRDTLSKEARNE